MKIRCKFCNKSIETKRNWQKYCSYECKYQFNKKKIIKQSIMWVKNNPEKFKEMQHKKYLKNKSKYFENAKRWRRNNLDKARQITKKSIKKLLDKNPNYYRKRNIKYYYKNKDKYNTRQISNKYRKGILNKYDNKCSHCGSTTKLEIHHIDYSWDKKFQRRKSNLKFNIDKVEVLCIYCHKKLHNMG